MPFTQNGDIRYFTFDSLNHPKIGHAVFTRQGGFSPKPWNSLNVGGFIGDDHEIVVKNRIRSFETIGRDPNSIYDVWQVHSAEVVCVDAPRDHQSPQPKADAIITANPAVTIFMRFADCVPILLFDPVKSVVGCVHAGWQGTVKQVVKRAVQAMMDKYGVAPGDILAGIGPSIGAHHYEVGENVISAVKKTFGEKSQDLLFEQNNTVQLGLWEANRYLLEQAGVTQIELASICTACHSEDWFSHRHENGKTGRFGALIALKERE